MCDLARAVQRQKRVVLLFVFAIVFPAAALGFFGLRALHADQFRIQSLLKREREESRRHVELLGAGELLPRGPAGALVREWFRYAKELARFDGCKSREQARNQRTKRFETIIPGDEHDDSDRQLRHVLLVLEILIPGDKYLEVGGGSAEQLTVLQTRPALLLDSLHVVLRKLYRKLPWQGFIE